VQSLKSGERKVLIDGGTATHYVPTGHIVYALGSTLLAIPFDIHKRQTIGGSVPVVEDVGRATAGLGGGYEAFFAISPAGSLVYVPGGSSTRPLFSIAVVDQNGVRKNLNLSPAPYQAPRVSPNGKQLAIDIDDGKEAAVWIYDLAENAPLRRLTFGGRSHRPMWTRDSQHVMFSLRSRRQKRNVVFATGRRQRICGVRAQGRFR